MYALEGKTGKIVWEFFLVPKDEGEVVRGPLGKSPLDSKTWNNAPGIPISGGGAWTSYTLDIKNGLLYVPGGNPAPDFASGAREGENLFTDSVVVLDAKTGDYKSNFKVVKKDWHDWDVSGPPILLQTMEVVVFNAHVHTTEMYDVDGVKYLMIGGGGAEQDPILPGRTSIKLPADYPPDLYWKGQPPQEEYNYVLVDVKPGQKTKFTLNRFRPGSAEPFATIELFGSAK